MPPTRRRATDVPRWTGEPRSRTSHHAGRSRQVVVFRPVSRRWSARLLMLAAVGAVLWAVATYAGAVLANRRMTLGFAESVRDSDFQLVLLGCGVVVWAVVGLPLVFGVMLGRELRDRALARAVTGPVVFRGVVDPRRGYDDGRQPEYYLAIDDGTTERLPAYRAGQSTVARVVEGDVVRASVTRTGVPRVLHLVVLDPAPTFPPP